MCIRDRLLSSESSALNNILMGLGLVKEPVNPLTNAKHAWLIQVAIGAWKTLGYNAIIYLSAITSIDQELYQACLLYTSGSLSAHYENTILITEGEPEILTIC